MGDARVARVRWEAVWRSRGFGRTRVAGSAGGAAAVAKMGREGLGGARAHSEPTPSGEHGLCRGGHASSCRYDAACGQGWGWVGEGWCVQGAG